MKGLHHLSLGLALAVGGILLGRAVFSHADGAASTASSAAEGRPTRPDRPGTRHSTPGPPVGGSRDLASLRAGLKEKAASRSDVQREMERMSPDALRALAVELRQAWLLPQADEMDKLASRNVMGAALDELYRREGTGALEWAAGLADKGASQGLTRRLLEACLKDDPDAARPWLEKYTAAQGKDDISLMTLYREALMGTVGKGAEEVVRVKQLFSDEATMNPLGGAEFPADFDFGKLFTGIGRTADLSGAMGQWAVRDKDAAWQALKSAGPLNSDSPESKEGKYFGALILGAVAKEGEAEGVRWALARLDELPEAQRAGWASQMEVASRLSPEGVTTIAAGLSPGGKKSFIRGLMREAATVPKAYAAMTTLPRQDLLEMLAASHRPAESLSPGGPAAAQTAREKKLADLQARFSLTAGEVEQLRKP